MTRDEAIEAGARALAGEFYTPYCGDEHPWDGLSEHVRDLFRVEAEAVLDAIGWAEPEVAE